MAVSRIARAGDHPWTRRGRRHRQDRPPGEDQVPGRDRRPTKDRLPRKDQRRGRHRWRKVALPAVTVAVLAAVAVGIFPRFANYSQAWSSIQRIPAAYLAGLAGAAIVNVAVGAWPLQAALPHLRYRPAFVVGSTSYALSNAVPAGGAIALGVEYDMLESYGFGAGPAASATAISSVFNIFATLVMPVLGVLALLSDGEVRWHFVLIAVVGVLAVGVTIGGFAVILHSDSGARGIGRLAERVLNPPLRRLHRSLTLDVTGKVLGFRSSVVEVMKRRPVAVAGSTLLPQLTSWLVLLVAARGLEGGAHTNFKLSWSESLAAFSFALVVSFIPITAGGLGTVDAVLTGLLAAFGTTGSDALAIDLVWRTGTFVPQVLTGALMFLLWEATSGRRRHGAGPDRHRGPGPTPES